MGEQSPYTEREKLSLVERLRNMPWCEKIDDIHREAADRIEELENRVLSWEQSKYRIYEH